MPLCATLYVYCLSFIQYESYDIQYDRMIFSMIVFNSHCLFFPFIPCHHMSLMDLVVSLLVVAEV
jgi:hypothetical protein